MGKRFWIVFAILVAIVLGLSIAASRGIFGGNEQKKNEVDISNFTWNQIITKDNLPSDYTDDPEIVVDHISGNSKAKVTLIEWMNFQCSACYSFSPTMREIEEKYSDRVAFVSRYLYLPNHPHGVAASVAAEAAGRQGKFHEMGDLLFENYTEWNDSSTSSRKDYFAKYAESLGLDMDKWNEDYDNYETNGIKARINFQNNLGSKNGVNASPYIFINGEKIDVKKDDIIKALDEALEE